MASKSETQIKKQLPKKDVFRADISIIGEPAEQANEMLARGLYGNKTDLIRQAIKELFRKESKQIPDEL